MLKILGNPRRKAFDNPEKLVDSSGIKQGEIVLEIGCGSGFFTVAASKAIGENGILYCTDISSASLEETQKRVTALSLENVVVKKDDALHSTFDDSMFDLVLLYGVAPAPFLPMEDISKEIHRLLKSDGICAIWTKAPFWTPNAPMRNAGFEKLKKQNGVFRFRKI